MGEDIHYRCYLKSKRDGKYVNAHEVCEWSPEHSMFSDLVEGRNYDAFSLFGSSRGGFKPIAGAEYGLPPFLNGGELDEYCKSCGYYGFEWFTLKSLCDGISWYESALADPRKYYGEDDDELATLLSPGEKSAEDIEEIVTRLREWYWEASKIAEKIERIRLIVKRFDECAKADCVYSRMFDLDETVFLVFFDC